MHRVERTIREIVPADLPTVSEIDGIERPATDAELLSMGLARIRGDYFSCVELHVGPDSASLAPERALPGAVLAAGELRDRYRRLPIAVKNKVMKARIHRAKNPAERAQDLVKAAVEAFAPVGPTARRRVEVEQAKESPEIEELLVTVEDIDPDADIVEEIDIIPHAWAGENI